MDLSSNDDSLLSYWHSNAYTISNANASSYETYSLLLLVKMEEARTYKIHSTNK